MTSLQSLMILGPCTQEHTLEEYNTPLRLLSTYILCMGISAAVTLGPLRMTEALTRSALHLLV